MFFFSYGDTSAFLGAVYMERVTHLHWASKLFIYFIPKREEPFT